MKNRCEYVGIYVSGSCLQSLIGKVPISGSTVQDGLVEKSCTGVM